LATGFLSCDPWFAFSPFEANLDEVYHGTTEKNLNRINALDAGDSKPFKIAVLSDPHYHYSKLSDALVHINRNDDYIFAIVTGDLTENGLMQEFIFFHQRMDHLKIPYLAVIGNHDYLSNGEKVYSQMYGAQNYSFVFNNVKFVMFDNTTIESEKDPDMEWLAGAILNDHGYDHVIPFSHIPPYDVQMKHQKQSFHDLLVNNGISISVHGHRHEFSVEETFGDGVQYITVSSPQKRTYTELSITPGAVGIRKIEY
jgi:predicted phosphodiesterase